MTLIRKTTKGFTLLELVVSLGLVGLLSALAIFPLSAWANGAAQQAREAEIDALNAATLQYLALIDRGAVPLSGWDTEAGAIENLRTGVSLRGEVIRLIAPTCLTAPCDENGVAYTPSSVPGKPGVFSLETD